MDDNLSVFEPSRLELTATVGISDTRIVAQLLTWNEGSTDFFTEGHAFVNALLLNDSSDSKHGPGVFLDDAAVLGVPIYEPTTNLPEPFYVQNRIGDMGFDKRFGLVTLRPDLITPNFSYTIRWATPSGNAEIDNANLQLVLGNKLFASCTSRACVQQSIRCQINEDEWGVDPIPGSFLWQQPYPGSCFDLNLLRVFLPVLRR